jgi:thiopeptide-type bacteriocin biosynthesis protein
VADVTLARLSHLPDSYPMPAPPEDPGQAGQALDYLRRVAADPVLREAIAVSSGTLAGTLDKIAEGEPPKAAKLRRAANATMRYLSRMTHRATPFGLLAGVAPVRFDERPKVSVGTHHGKPARADYAWLDAVLRPLRADPAVLPHLHVAANDLCRVRDGRLVLPYATTAEERPARKEPERTVRHTGAIAFTMETARTPIRFPDLLHMLVARYSDVPPAAIGASLAGLVEQEFLLTDLTPPPTAADPIRHALDRLAQSGHPVAAALAEVAAALDAYAARPIGGGDAEWRRATAAMRALNPSGNLVQVDLRVDADITLPDTVREEFAAAAAAAYRVFPDGYGIAERLAGFRHAFVERYGHHRLVPVQELLDPITGLGLPDGHQARHDTATTPRDKALCALAQEAAATGRREIELDDALLDRLAVRDGPPDPDAYIEACAEVLADDEDALRDGDFRLALTGSYGARIGALYGRFLHVLPELAEPVAGQIAATLGGPDGAVPAQLGTVLWHSRMLNVKQVPPLSETAISAGGALNIPDPGHAPVITLDDVAVTVDREDERLRVVCLRTGRDLVPFAPHALSLAYGLPPAVRLLIEIGMLRARPWQLWYWGAADALPYLPRVRRGRTVLASARWRPDAELTGGDLGWPAWRARWEEWRARWYVPDRVYAATSDNRFLVDLTSEGELRMLRAELERRPATVLYERPTDGEYGRGWIGGHASEVVFAVGTARAAAPAASPRRPPYRRVPEVMHHPGGEWLYAKIAMPLALQDRVLSGHLPGLIERVRPLTDRWFFMRYSDEELGEQLRLRFHGSPGELWGSVLGTLHDWLAGLREAGLAGSFTLATYQPETVRYGGPEAIADAERAFAADSEAALRQLAMRTAGELELPLELIVAANHLDLLIHLMPDNWRRWLLHTYPKDDYHRAFQAHRRRAVELLDPSRDWAALRKVPGGAALADTWRDRARAVRAYGGRVRALAAENLIDAGTHPFMSLLHLSHNRHAGFDVDAERSTYAILRGAVQAHLDRERHQS